jgi:hypothetical protein
MAVNSAKVSLSLSLMVEDTETFSPIYHLPLGITLEAHKYSEGPYSAKWHF